MMKIIVIIVFLTMSIIGCTEPWIDDDSDDYYCAIGDGRGWEVDAVWTIEQRDNILTQMKSLGLLETHSLEALSRLVGIEGHLSGNMSGSFLGFNGSIGGSVKTKVWVLFAWKLDERVYPVRLPFEDVFFEINEAHESPMVKIRWHLKTETTEMPLGNSLHRLSRPKYIYSAKIIASNDDLQNGVYIKIFP